MASSQGLDLLLTPETESRDGVSTELQSEERFGVLLLAVALWDVAARLVRCVLHAATSFVITRFLTEQLEGRMKESAEPGISLAARQEVCRKRCSASKAPSQSLLLTGTVPSQLTVGQPVLDKLQAFHAVYRIKEFDTIVRTPCIRPCPAVGWSKDESDPKLGGSIPRCPTSKWCLIELALYLAGGPGFG